MLRLTMCVKNEEQRYLRRVLDAARAYIDSAVIIDDASTDGTAALCEDVLKNIPHRVIRNEQSKFENEWELRKQQWNASTSDLAENGADSDWLLFLDADEILEDGFANGVAALMEDGSCDLYSFRLYDFWTEDAYREDALWCAHTFYRPFLLRYRKNFACTFKETSQHCGRMPSNVFALPNKLSAYRVKHYGWATPEDRLAKFKRYMELDPMGQHGNWAQYLSILEERPRLVKWKELNTEAWLQTDPRM